MKNILVTGVRAPAGLEIIRRLGNAGYNVYVADSLHFPPGRFSNHVQDYLQFSSPRYDLKSFKEQLIIFVKKHQIDIIFPICEEVFYLGACKAELEKHCRIFCEDIALLSQLHNKYIFQQIAAEQGMGAIETFIVDNPNDPLPELYNERTYIAKPVFSRFGDKAILDLKPQDIKENLSSPLFPWAIQEHIKGEEFCDYAICRDGVVIAQACYQPYFRAGQGSSVYFKAVSKPAILDQVQSLVRGLNYTGQIGFDFIERTDGQIFVLECNPRCTSGAHLIPNIDWKTVFSDVQPDYSLKSSTLRSKMIALAMLVYGLRAPNTHRLKEFIVSYLNADDVMFSKKDWKPSIGQFLSLLEIIWRSLRDRQSLKEASTEDIEWDGQDIE